MHIHLDCVGGISGNMFVGALLECWPEFAKQLPEQIEKAGFAKLVTLSTEEKNDGVLKGSYFNVVARDDEGSHAHSHRDYDEIRTIIITSSLQNKVKTHALGIFRSLAIAEAKVHGKKVEEVAFHEVGAWDSIADIISAAFLIDACGATTWSVSNLPLGRGQVKTAHGMLPVPAPAVALLLEDFSFYDDGLDGERITPTGAAILKYLQANQIKPSAGLILVKSGFGFGSRTFPGLSNVLRVVVFDSETTGSKLPWQEDEVLELAFEVDDQNPEDLAHGLDIIRQLAGVLDITQHSVMGKKQRTVSSIKIMIELVAEPQILTACFNETTTLGIRKQIIRRAVLARKDIDVELDGKSYRVKMCTRPNGELTAKAEFDDYAQEELSQNERVMLKQEVEAMAFVSFMKDKESD